MKKFLLAIILFFGLGTGSFWVSDFTSEVQAYSLDDAIEKHLEGEEDKEKARKELTPDFMPATASSRAGNAADITLATQKLINVLVVLAGAIAVIFIIYNAIVLVVAAGNSDQITNAKKGLFWAVIGLVLIIFAYVIVKTIISLTYSGEKIEVPQPAVEAPASGGRGGPSGGEPGGRNWSR